MFLCRGVAAVRGRRADVARAHPRYNAFRAQPRASSVWPAAPQQPHTRGCGDRGPHQPFSAGCTDVQGFGTCSALTALTGARLPQPHHAAHRAPRHAAQAYVDVHACSSSSPVPAQICASRGRRCRVPMCCGLRLRTTTRSSLHASRTPIQARLLSRLVDACMRDCR